MLHDATYTQLEVQHNLQPRSLRIFLFCVSVVPFSGRSFQIRFSVAIYFRHPFSKFFFDGSLLRPQFFWHYTTWPFYTFFFLSGCVCVCVVDPVFSWCCPALTAFRCYPSGVVLFWHSRIVIAFIISLPKKTGWFSWHSMTLSTGSLLRGFDFLGLWFRWLGLVDAVLFFLEVYGVVVRSFLLLVF